jgi:P2-related tail formation protein
MKEGVMVWKDGFTAVSIVVSTLVIVTGWFVNQRDARKHEKFKIRLAKTEKIAEAVIERELSTYELLEAGGKMEADEQAAWKKTNALTWHRLCLLVQVYGQIGEQSALATYERAIVDNKPLAEQAAALNVLKDLLVKSIRSGLGY